MFRLAHQRSGRAGQTKNPDAVCEARDRRKYNQGTRWYRRAPASSNPSEWVDDRPQTNGITAKGPHEVDELAAVTASTTGRASCRVDHRTLSADPQVDHDHLLISTGDRSSHKEDSSVEGEAHPRLPYHTVIAGLRNHQRRGQQRVMPRSAGDD